MGNGTKGPSVFMKATTTTSNEKDTLTGAHYLRKLHQEFLP